MTATVPDKIASDDPSALSEPSAYERSRSRAEALLALALDALGVTEDTPCSHLSVESIPVVATVGAGFAQLAAVDFATEQANAQARLFGSILDEFRAIVASAQPVIPQWPDLVIDVHSGIWRHVDGGSYVFEGVDDLPAHDLAELRRWSSPTREYVLLPQAVAG